MYQSIERAKRKRKKRTIKKELKGATSKNFFSIASRNQRLKSKEEKTFKKREKKNVENKNGAFIDLLIDFIPDKNRNIPTAVGIIPKSEKILRIEPKKIKISPIPDLRKYVFNLKPSNPLSQFLRLCL